MSKGPAGGKNRKYGRHKKECEIYRTQRRREKNKKRRLKALLKKQPNNQQIVAALDRL